MGAETSAAAGSAAPAPRLRPTSPVFVDSTSMSVASCKDASGSLTEGDGDAVLGRGLRARGLRAVGFLSDRRHHDRRVPVPEPSEDLVDLDRAAALRRRSGDLAGRGSALAGDGQPAPAPREPPGG